MKRDQRTSTWTIFQEVEYNFLKMVRLTLEPKMNIVGTILAWLMYLAFIYMIVTGRSDTATSRFAVFPKSPGDALALAFHTLEVIVTNGVILIMCGVSSLHSLIPLAILATGISSIILVVLSLASWRRDRSLSITGLLFGAPVAALFLLMVR